MSLPRSIIVSMSPPGYPSAWLRPSRARFRFTRQNHCNAAWRSAPIREDARLLTAKLALAPRRFQLAIARGKDLGLASLQLGQRRDIADGAVQPHPVVMIHVGLHQAARIFHRQRGTPGRMHSSFSDLCQRSILPFDCG